MLALLFNILRIPMGKCHDIGMRLFRAILRRKIEDLQFMQSAEQTIFAAFATDLEKGMSPAQRKKLLKSLVQFAKLCNELGDSPPELLPLLQKLLQLQQADQLVALAKQEKRAPSAEPENACAPAPSASLMKTPMRQRIPIDKPHQTIFALPNQSPEVASARQIVSPNRTRRDLRRRQFRRVGLSFLRTLKSARHFASRIRCISSSLNRLVASTVAGIDRPAQRKLVILSLSKKSGVLCTIRIAVARIFSSFMPAKVGSNPVLVYLSAQSAIGRASGFPMPAPAGGPSTPKRGLTR